MPLPSSMSTACVLSCRSREETRPATPTPLMTWHEPIPVSWRTVPCPCRLHRPSLRKHRVPSPDRSSASLKGTTRSLSLPLIHARTARATTRLVRRSYARLPARFFSVRLPYSAWLLTKGRIFGPHALALWKHRPRLLHRAAVFTASVEPHAWELCTLYSAHRSSRSCTKSLPLDAIPRALVALSTIATRRAYSPIGENHYLPLVHSITHGLCHKHARPLWCAWTVVPGRTSYHPYSQGTIG